MPIYEFTCSDCQEKFSELRRIGDDKNVPCPACGSTNTGKRISSFSSASSSSRCAPSGGG